MAASIVALLLIRSVPNSAVGGRSSARVADNSGIANLIASLTRAKSFLTAETVNAIKQSLATADRAVREAESAAIAEPRNAFLTEYLNTVRERRLHVIRDAALRIGAFN